LSLTSEKVGKKASEFVLLSLTTKGVIVRDIESGKGKFPKDFDTYQIVKPNELVFCLFDIDETPRTVGLVETEGMLTGAYTAFKVYTELAIPEYIYNYYLCVDNIKALKPYYSGLRKTVRADKFQQIYMPLPPLNEQQAIVAYIEKKCQKIDKLASELQSEIDYLKEYKQRLIADCVTGQVNVQNEMI
jgi:type I restriction enzyme S subunit